jgi:hypothetical protein
VSVNNTSSGLDDTACAYDWLVFALPQSAFQARWLDESDCVGAWESEAVAAVLFPTGGTLPAVRAIDAAQVPLATHGPAMSIQ